MHSTKKCLESITLTHIINPHMFWFRPESSYCNNEKYWALEEALSEYFHESKVTENHQNEFRVGEMVAVYMETWGKWIRVIVDKIIKMLHGQTKCVLWAVDWGFPLQTDLARLRKLPFECTVFEVQDLYFAGLSNIVPSETTFDFTLLKCVEIQSQDWSELVVKEFRKLIEQASNINFIPVIEKTERYPCFGLLEITTHNGIVINANDVLLQISGVMNIENNKEFLIALHKCNSTKIQRCYNNRNRLSFSDLNYDTLTSKGLDMEYKHENNFFHSHGALTMALPSRNIVDKVVEWERRNCEVNSVVGPSEVESDIGTLVLEDEAFDSISCYADQELSIKSQSYRNYFDDEEDECFVLRCDLVRQNIRKKYQGRIPRSPIIPYELPQKEENAETCPYIKKIIDKRKKLMESDKMTVSTISAPSIESDIGSNEMSQLSYLDKLKEKRARALRSIEEKESPKTDTMQSKSVRNPRPNNPNITLESNYDKEEQQRRDKIKQSIRGNDPNIGMYPIEYDIKQIIKGIQNKKYPPPPKTESKPSNLNGKKQHQRQNENKNFNNKSPQQRLDKYNNSSIKSNKNDSFAEHPSEAESDVW